jgi:hypothetical protein
MKIHIYALLCWKFISFTLAHSYDSMVHWNFFEGAMGPFWKKPSRSLLLSCHFSFDPRLTVEYNKFDCIFAHNFFSGITYSVAVNSWLVSIWHDNMKWGHQIENGVFCMNCRNNTIGALLENQWNVMKNLVRLSDIFSYLLFV